MKRSDALKLRDSIVSIRKEATDEMALHSEGIYPKWKDDADYIKDDRVMYLDILYKCLQNHTAQPSWNPKDATSLWVKVLNEEIKEWEQPTAENAYMKGDKVLHNGFKWQSDIDVNVWEPGVYGWSKIE